MSPDLPDDVQPVIARLAEHDASRLLAALARRLGPAGFDLAEDAVQHALLQALRLWPRTGLPAQPASWLFQVARNHIRDRLRRERRLVTFDIDLDDMPAPQKAQPSHHFARELSDDELAMLFTACHPALSMQSRIAFALKVVCGLSVGQIAAALLVGEVSVAKRLTRAKNTLARLDIRIEPPPPGKILERQEAVRAVIYLLFNEGYSSSAGEDLSEPVLCREAVRLSVALARHPLTASPQSDALAALLLLTFARIPGRLGSDGSALILEDQRRDLWDRQAIAEGLRFLAQSARGTLVSVWHLRAEIAALHVIAPTEAQTDWARLAAAYDGLCAIDSSPIAALGRAVAISRVQGPTAGLRALRAPLRALPDNPYMQAAVGRFLLDLGKARLAGRRFARALRIARTEPDRRLMRRHLAEARKSVRNHRRDLDGRALEQ